MSFPFPIMDDRQCNELPPADTCLAVSDNWKKSVFLFVYFSLQQHQDVWQPLISQIPIRHVPPFHNDSTSSIMNNVSKDGARVGIL
eukprot:scaffold53885_cov46-Attheya_sp.AAC.3